MFFAEDAAMGALTCDIHKIFPFFGPYTQNSVIFDPVPLNSPYTQNIESFLTPSLNSTSAGTVAEFPAF